MFPLGSAQELPVPLVIGVLVSDCKSHKKPVHSPEIADGDNLLSRLYSNATELRPRL